MASCLSGKLYWVESGNLLKINTESKECARADVNNNEMFEVDENIQLKLWIFSIWSSCVSVCIGCLGLGAVWK